MTLTIICVFIESFNDEDSNVHDSEIVGIEVAKHYWIVERPSCLQGTMYRLMWSYWTKESKNTGGRRTTKWLRENEGEFIGTKRYICIH